MDGLYLYIMENPIKMDGLGGTAIFGNIHVAIYNCKEISLKRRPPPQWASVIAGLPDRGFCFLQFSRGLSHEEDTCMNHIEAHAQFGISECHQIPITINKYTCSKLDHIERQGISRYLGNLGVSEMMEPANSSSSKGA